MKGVKWIGAGLIISFVLVLICISAFWLAARSNFWQKKGGLAIDSSAPDPYIVNCDPDVQFIGLDAMGTLWHDTRCLIQPADERAVTAPPVDDCVFESKGQLLACPGKLIIPETYIEVDEK
ncbi:MAG: hypothetical protein P1S60_15545 [Anaerolineae bacterium]|nr:hypothetical protein [Anaerolineae bacterium]